MGATKTFQRNPDNWSDIEDNYDKSFLELGIKLGPQARKISVREPRRGRDNIRDVKAHSSIKAGPNALQLDTHFSPTPTHNTKLEANNMFLVLLSNHKMQ